jgi:hypothetical protein
MTGEDCKSRMDLHLGELTLTITDQVRRHTKKTSVVDLTSLEISLSGLSLRLASLSSEAMHPLPLSSLVGYREMRVQDGWTHFLRRGKRCVVLRRRHSGRHSSLGSTAAPLLVMETETRTPPGECCIQASHVRIAPLRCFMDDALAAFMTALVAAIPTRLIAHRQAWAKKKADTSEMRREVRVESLEVILDYKCAALDLLKLRRGDGAQLLALFPLEGLEIELKRIVHTGFTGTAQELFTWVVYYISTMFCVWVLQSYGTIRRYCLSGGQISIEWNSCASSHPPPSSEGPQQC